MHKQILLIGFICFQFNLFAQQDAWIYLSDKQNVEVSISNPTSILTQKAIDRKSRHGVTIDSRDVPVNEDYITQLKSATGIIVKAKSKWFNAVHVRGSQTDIELLSGLSFVSSIDFADKSLNINKISGKQKSNKVLEKASTIFNYGNSANQINMINGDKLHLADYTGVGMTVAVLDAGFPNVNIMGAFQRLRDGGNLLGSYDFVNRDSDVYTGTLSNHGTMVLSTMSGYVENQFVGTAPDASYYLFITEDAPNENPVEESYWVEAAERADSLGVDIINTSLGYTDFDNSNYNYTKADMDGNTAFITRGANIAYEKGMLLVNSAGNSGSNSWGIVGAPADAPGVLSIGAVNAVGGYASFSSRGDATQPTLKPDVVTQGQSSYVITENNVITTSNGTSFSCPILAGGIVCLWQALPNKTNAEIMQLVRESASQYNTPDYLLGYGIPDLELALNMEILSVYDSSYDTLLSIFPNPSSNKIYVKTPSEIDRVKLYVYDAIGKMVMSYFISNTDNEVDISSLLSGIYTFKLESTVGNKSFKIIKH